MSEETVPCKVCNAPAAVVGTKLCDPCWELDRLIRAKPKEARKILFAVEMEKAESRGRIVNRVL